MPDGTHGAHARDTLIRLPIGELIAWHLVVRCGGCREDRFVQMEGLVGRFGSDKTLLGLLPRLRCRVPECGQRPAVVRLRNRFPVQPGPALVDVVVLERT